MWGKFFPLHLSNATCGRDLAAQPTKVRLNHFSARSQNCEKRLLASSCLFARPSVRMEQLGSHWTDFPEIWYLRIFRKTLQKIQVSLKSDKNNEYFTWRPIHIFIISRSVLLRMRDVPEKKSCRGNHNTYFLFGTFFSKIVPFLR